MSTPEQDHQGGDDLPTYEDLAAQKGPNSRHAPHCLLISAHTIDILRSFRFGRWRGWVEKRAAERYQDISYEERVRRRQRGWGDGVDDDLDDSDTLFDDIHQSLSSALPEAVPHEPPSYPEPAPDTNSIIPTGRSLSPAHLSLHTFGSRFLPHSTSQIRTLLPIMGHRLLLIGHDDGLSVLDLFPSGDPQTSGPADAESKAIWEGEGVYQLELLEFESGGATPQGVVLALVGSDTDTPGGKDHDNMRSIRMYNLVNLTNLARWALTREGGKSLDLRRHSHWSPQLLTPKKHKHHSSITKGFKFMQEPSGLVQASEPRSSYQSMMTSSPISPQRVNSSNSEEANWDIVDDVPLRWATDYVPLAAAGSRLVNYSVLFFELKRDEYRPFGGRSLLAVGTKSNIFLYETPKGERAFIFLKEFYTPLQPRNVTFVQQRAQDPNVARSASGANLLPPKKDADFRRQSMHLPPGSPRDWKSSTSTSPSLEHGNQLSLFVVFEKKAGLIRIADSAVGEVEMYNDQARDNCATSGSLRLSRASFDGLSFVKDSKSPWLAPVLAELPTHSSSKPSQTVFFLTRGKQTHVHPSPLPTPISAWPPLKILTWLSQPRNIRHRVCTSPDGIPFLQLVALGEMGVEVQELSLSFLTKGKGKARLEEPVRAQSDVGEDTGFLCHGGMWDEPQVHLTRSDSVLSYDSVSTANVAGWHSSQEGIYAWCQKDPQDWRVFWLGGTGDEVIGRGEESR